MEKEMSFVMIKPDGVRQRVNLEIIRRFYEQELDIVKYEEDRMLTEELIKKHYSHLLDKPFFPKLKNFMMSGPVITMIIEGEDAIKKIRELVGATDSSKALPGTIRGDFGNKENVTENVIHASDSKEAARNEIMNFFNIDIQKDTLTKDKCLTLCKNNISKER